MRQRLADEKSSIIRQRVEKSHQLQPDQQEKTNSRLRGLELRKLISSEKSLILAKTY